MPKIPFTKVAEKNSDQLIRLTNRGVSISDQSSVYEALTRIGYYRLTGYMLPFQTGHQPDPHKFKSNINFDKIRHLYELDRRLRGLILDAVEQIEVAVRSAICNKLALKHGPHWHTKSALFSLQEWPDIEKRIAEALDFDLVTQSRRSSARSGSHLFIDHYYNQYDPPAIPPCWMLMEVASLGLVTRMFKNLTDASDKKSIAREFTFSDGKPIDESVLNNWLHGVSVLRNRCAHHSRIVNRVHPFSPTKTTNKTVSHLFNGGARTREFLVVLAVLIGSVNPKSDWVRRLYFLLDTSSNVDISNALGFPDPWHKDDLWTLAW